MMQPESSFVSSRAKTQRTAELPQRGFSLASLMMVVTLVSLVCGLFTIAPGLGFAATVVLLPALAHAAIVIQREKGVGHALALSEKLALFAGSLGLVVVAGGAAAIAFGVTCFGGFLAGGKTAVALGETGPYAGLGWGLVTGVGLGGIAAAYVCYRVLVILSRKWGQDAVSGRAKLILLAAVILAVVAALLAAGAAVS